jgi:hypothetical protein
MMERSDAPLAQVWRATADFMFVKTTYDRLDGPRWIVCSALCVPPALICYTQGQGFM